MIEFGTDHHFWKIQFQSLAKLLTKPPVKSTYHGYKNWFEAFRNLANSEKTSTHTGARADDFEIPASAIE